MTQKKSLLTTDFGKSGFTEEEIMQLRYEIINIRTNKLLARYLLQTAQIISSSGVSLQFKPSHEEGTFPKSEFVSQPIEVHPAQSQFL